MGRFYQITPNIFQRKDLGFQNKITHQLLSTMSYTKQAWGEGINTTMPIMKKFEDTSGEF